MFPERQLLLKSSRGVRSLRFPGWLQAMVVIACFATLASAGFLSAQYVALHRTLDQIAGVDNSSLLSLNTDTPDAARAIANCIGPREVSAEYIVPSVFNRQVVQRVAAAVQRAALQAGVARKRK